MGWQDRPYYRDRGGEPGFASNPIMWLLAGSVPLFTAFGIRVRAHASLIIFIVLVLLFGLGRGFTVQDRVLSMSVLFVIVLLHEFGHCFAARWVGGSADDILMHPLGGLAMAHPPQRPLPTFITVAGGPLVNVLICLACGGLLWATSGRLPLNPFAFDPLGATGSWINVYVYAYWIFQISWMLLVFNLLPIFPLDGGQLLQSILWPWMGHHRSMMLATAIGIVGGILMAMVGLASGQGLLFFVAISGIFTCVQMRRALQAAGPYAEPDATDYSAAYELAGRSRRSVAAEVKRVDKRRKQEQAEQAQIDRILAKVSADGMNSLTWAEKRTLRKATERQRATDQARARRVR